MDWDNCLRALRDRVFDQALVEVERVGADVDEYRRGATQRDSVRSRYEREGRHDHLIAVLQLREYRRKLERRAARSGQQRPGGAGVVLEPAAAASGEGAVSR